MEEKNSDAEYKKTQTTSSPGNLGEDVNRLKSHPEKIGKESGKTSKKEGLNEERSAGDAGAFEGLENTADN